MCISSRGLALFYKEFGRVAEVVVIESWMRQMKICTTPWRRRESDIMGPRQGKYRRSEVGSFRRGGGAASGQRCLASSSASLHLLTNRSPAQPRLFHDLPSALCSYVLWKLPVWPNCPSMYTQISIGNLIQSGRKNRPPSLAIDYFVDSSLLQRIVALVFVWQVKETGHSTTTTTGILEIGLLKAKPRPVYTSQLSGAKKIKFRRALGIWTCW
jgi:hypothetical protein